MTKILSFRGILIALEFGFGTNFNYLKRICALNRLMCYSHEPSQLIAYVIIRHLFLLFLAENAILITFSRKVGF